MKKILTVSLVAIMAATAANADIASTKYVTDRTGNTTFTGSIAESADLTVAVNALAGKVDTAVGDSTTSVTDQISAAKEELQENIDGVAGDLADYEVANDKALADGLALKQDVANLATALTDGMNKETTYPSVSLMEEQIAKSNNAVGDEIADLTQLVNTNETDIEGKVSALTTTVTNNKTAADTGIQEAKDAAAQALADAKTYADAQDTAQTTAITTAYQAADSALKTELEGKITSAAGDASAVADDLAEYKTDNDVAVAAAQAAADNAQADLNAYKTSNDAAVAKAQTDAVASAKTYTDGEIDKVEAAYAAADTALETSLKSYADTAEADAIAAAKTAGDAAYAAKSYEAIVDADQAFRESITAGTTGSDGTYALTATVSDGSVSGYKWELIGR